LDFLKARFYHIVWALFTHLFIRAWKHVNVRKRNLILNLLIGTAIINLPTLPLAFLTNALLHNTIVAGIVATTFLVGGEDYYLECQRVGEDTDLLPLTKSLKE